MVVLLALALLAIKFALPAGAQTITNLHQLTQALNSNQQTNGDVDIEATVCAASRPKVGVLIVQDETGVELLQMGGFEAGDFARGASPHPPQLLPVAQTRNGSRDLCHARHR